MPFRVTCNYFKTKQEKEKKKDKKERKKQLTSVLLFFCQCCTCSCCVRFGAREHSSFCAAPLWLFPIEKSCSWSVLQSNGLHSPKSESLKCPYLSRSKLSGLISLERYFTNRFNLCDTKKLNICLLSNKQNLPIHLKLHAKIRH